MVAAPEERIVISTLQRVYRHFYFRLCDMIDTAALLKVERVDFDELKRAANSAGIWQGVATYLRLIQNYFNLMAELWASRRRDGGGISPRVDGAIKVGLSAGFESDGRETVFIAVASPPASTETFGRSCACRYCRRWRYQRSSRTV